MLSSAISLVPASRIEGIGLDVIAEEAFRKHAYAFQPVSASQLELRLGGNYSFRAQGEYHLYNPLTISKLQHAVQQTMYQTFEEYTDLIDKQSRQLCTLRGLLGIKLSEDPIPP